MKNFRDRLSHPGGGKAVALLFLLVIVISFVWGILYKIDPLKTQVKPADTPGPEHEARRGSVRCPTAAASAITEPAAALRPGWGESRLSGSPKVLSLALASLIRPENIAPEKKSLAFDRLGKLKAQTQLEKELIAGAEAYLSADYPAAENHFKAALTDFPDDPYLWSLTAASALKAGHIAQAEDYYLKALVAKSKAGLTGLGLSADQLGLALSLFRLGRPAEALPLAERSWQSRKAALGLASPETLSAANRLAAILVALGRDEQAEELLKEAYLGAAGQPETNESGLAETLLLLTLLMEQSSRPGELESFLAADSSLNRPFDQLEPLAGDDAAGPQNPGPETIQYDLETLRNIAANLSGDNEVKWRLDRPPAAVGSEITTLAADLRLHILQRRIAEEKLEPGAAALRPDILELIRSFIAASRFEQAETEAALLLDKITDKNSADFFAPADLMAQSLQGQSKFSQAEIWWHDALEPIDARLLAAKKEGREPAPDDISRSLTLHIKIAGLFQMQGRTLQESEIELKSALNRIDKKYAAAHPETAEAYLRLGRILWLEGQKKNAASFYGQARTAALALAEEQGDAGQRNYLEALIRQATEELSALKARRKTPPPLKEAAETNQIPPPELLQNEFAALRALGRASELEGRLTLVLDKAAGLYGSGDQRYMRYYGLKLKMLQEGGRFEELITELIAQVNNPPGRNEAERLLNRCGALIYTAGIYERAELFDEATLLYRQVAAEAEGRPEKAIASRKAMAEEALIRLKQKTGL